jgi:hypothetical protein
MHPPHLLQGFCLLLQDRPSALLLTQAFSILVQVLRTWLKSHLDRRPQPGTEVELFGLRFGNKAPLRSTRTGETGLPVVCIALSVEGYC